MTPHRYFYPPDGAAFAGAAAVSVLDSVMSLTGTTHHSFVNLTFSTSRETAVSVTGADSVIFDGCTVSNSGTTCLSISGSNSIVKNSEISGCGGTGIHVSGGSIKTLARGNMSKTEREGCRHCPEPMCVLRVWWSLTRRATIPLLRSGA